MSSEKVTDKVAFTELLLTLAPRAVNAKVKALLVTFACTTQLPTLVNTEGHYRHF